MLAASIFAPASAIAAWSVKQQVIGLTSERAPVVAVEKTGTVDLGISTGGGGLGPGPSSGAFYVSRTTAATGWSGTGVTITKITGAPPSANWAVSPSGAALVTWAEGSPAQTLAAFKAPGGSWGAATLLDSSGARTFNEPIPLINDAGQAAVVWGRKAAGESYALNMPNQVVFSVPTALGWPAAPTKLADVSVPTPQVSDGEGGFKFSGCPLDLKAAIQPGGTPVAAWADAYGSWREKSGAETTLENALCGVRVSVGAAPTSVTARTNATWLQEPTPGLASWALLGISASPTDGSVALVLRGLEDSLTFGGSCTVNACKNAKGETRVALGTGASVSGPGSLVGTSSNAVVALRNGRTAVVTYSAADGLRAGVSSTFPTFPTLAPLSPSVSFASAAIVLNEAGATHVGIPGVSPAGLHLFDAPAAGSFAAGSELDNSSGVQRAPSIAIDCKGDAVAVWARTSPAGQIYTSNFDSAPSACSGEPEPEPEPTPGGGGGGGGAKPTTTIVSTPPPTPATLATLANLKVDQNGSKVSFQIVCSPLTNNACGGTIVITKSNNGGKARAAAKAPATKLGSVSFSGLAPGKKRTLKVPLVKSAKQALAAGKSIKALITATVKDGAGNIRVTTKRATLKLPGA